MRHSEAVRVVQRIGAAFPRTELSQETLSLYAEHLLTSDYETALQAVSVGLRRWRFFPTIAELTEVIDGEEHSEIVAPELAWAEVIAAVRAGPNRKPWSSPAIDYAVRAIGGMSYLNSAPLADCPGPDRARFVDAYRAALRHCNDEAWRDRLSPPPGEAGTLVADLTRKLTSGGSR